ncbi:hypothetical protein FRB99_007150 [Tulasnella sp. 403]|nr:hypothetical protein FRB99_007150 [Tulasnella sp. 403]
MNRIHEVKRYWEATGNPDRHLNRVYIMSNAEPEFLEAVRNGLAKAGWDSVMTTYDLTIPRGAEEVVVAADMLIGERAELFLGNGKDAILSAGEL